MTRQEIATEVAKNIDFFREQCEHFCKWVENYAAALSTQSGPPPRLDPQQDKQEEQEFKKKQKKYERELRKFEKGKRTEKPLKLAWLALHFEKHMTITEQDYYCLNLRCEGGWRPLSLVHPLGAFGLPHALVTPTWVRRLTDDERRLCYCVVLGEVYSRETWGIALDDAVFPSECGFNLKKFLRDLDKKLDTPAGEGMIQLAWVRISAFLKGQQDKSKQMTFHNADFTMVNWYGTQYTFAPNIQAKAVAILWQEGETTGFGLHQQTIGKAAGAEDGFRMDKAFRNHPAFGTMIQACGDGIYCLRRPAL